MEFKKTAALAGLAGLGGAAGAAVLSLAGAPLAAAGLGGLIAAGGAAAAGRARFAGAGHKRLMQAIEALQVDMAERDARIDAKLAEIERRTIESPALVWRAATADIEVLGSLVSSLARTVSEHDRALSGREEPRVADEPEATNGPPGERDIVSVVEAPAVIFNDGPESYFEDSVVDDAPPALPAQGMTELKSTLAAALASDRLELCLQPIVALPQRKVRGYEATLRLKGEAGEHRSDADLRRIAAASGLEPEFDRALVERALQVLRILRARNREVSAVCAIAGASLSSPGFRAMLEMRLRTDPALAMAVTLELSDADLRSLDAAGRDAARGLSASGVGFGLSRLPRLKFDVADASALGVRQVRVPAAAMLAAAQDESRSADIHPADLAEFLQRRGIELLISDIASEQTVLDLLDYAAPLASGPLFGGARPVRPEVLEPKAVAGRATPPRRPPADEPPAAVAAPAAPRAQRQSLRSILRRA